VRKKSKKWQWTKEACHHLLHLRKKKDDDKLMRLAIIYNIWKKKMTMNLLARCHLLHMKKKWWSWWTRRLVIIFCTWGKNQERLMYTYLPHMH
jgi:hypothetical protein